MSDESTTPASVLVGRALKPIGLAGELRVEVSSNVPERYAPGALLFINDNPYHVARTRQTRHGTVVKLIEVMSREQAEELLGKALYVQESQVPPQAEGIYYHYQILGIRVYSRADDYLGEITDILTTGSNDVYVVSGGLREILVPALKGVVIEIDTTSRRMIVDLPDGL